MFISLINNDCNIALEDLEDSSIDLIITSPPYCMKKAYESPEDDIDTFKKLHEEIFDKVYRVLKPGGQWR